MVINKVECILYDTCSDRNCEGCWAYDPGDYEQQNINEYYVSLTDFISEYNEMIRDYSDDESCL